MNWAWIRQRLYCRREHKHDFMKLSIITINRNNAAGLLRTLESTLGGQRDFNDWEQIVVDGASTDGSFAALQKWKNDCRLGWHVSEPDQGIYNAMNKGASHAKGEYLLFLNSGDELIPNILGRVFQEPFEEEIVYGDLRIIGNDGSVSDRTFPNSKELSALWFLYDFLPHPASFISRRYLQEVNGYDESYQIIADVKFFINAVTGKSARLRHLPLTVSRFYGGGVSSDPAFSGKKRAERFRMFSEKFGQLTAHRVLFPPEGRAWILPDVAEAAKKDPQLAHFLLCSSFVVAHLWKIRILSIILHGIDWLLSRLRRSRKSTGN